MVSGIRRSRACAVLSAIIGVILASAFSAILVYSQELVPGKVGTMSGLFFGLAFGLGDIGSAVLGALGDRRGIPYVFQVCSYLTADRPAHGALAIPRQDLRVSLAEESNA
jgi:MFS transporter, FSR family, fosmidomycin resistance protein